MLECLPRKLVTFEYGRAPLFVAIAHWSSRAF